MTLALIGSYWCYATTGSCSNSCVQLQKTDIEHMRCKLSRLKRAGELYDTGSDWIVLVLCGKGFVLQWVRVQTLGAWCWCWFVFKHFCSLQKAPAAMQTEQAEKSRRTFMKHAWHSCSEGYLGQKCCASCGFFAGLGYFAFAEKYSNPSRPSQRGLALKRSRQEWPAHGPLGWPHGQCQIPNRIQSQHLPAVPVRHSSGVPCLEHLPNAMTNHGPKTLDETSGLR